MIAQSNDPAGVAVPVQPVNPMDIEIPRRELPPRPEPARPRLWLWALLTFTGLFFTPPLMVLALRWLPPPTTAFMLRSEVRPVQYQWVPASAVAETARKAVVAAEDQKFWTHFGFDLEAIEKAMAHNQKNQRTRGASTITQQVAKNLFLWPGRSYLRKGVEVTFTVLIELLWSKDRILEVYLNIAEFGPGIYGVEAAAQKFFGKPAAQLLPGEAARLAAVLPNPRKWRADRPGPYVQLRTEAILRLMGYRPPQPAPVEELEEPPLELPDEAPADEAPQTGTEPEPEPEPVPTEPAPESTPEPTPAPGGEPVEEQPPSPEAPWPEEPAPPEEEPPPERAALGRRPV
jgi:monofunctional biosynthetic peptidoglycan transglycosylase